MNPFDLRGPEFLVFYFLLGIATLVIVGWRRRASEEAAASRGPVLGDYLQIAYLRGGAPEALRVATLDLINRGLLDVSDDDTVQARDPEAIASVTRPVERRILEKFQSPKHVSTMSTDTALGDAVALECEPTLVRLGLLPDAARSAKRRELFLLGAAVLVAVAMTKIVIAFSRGRSNVLFLIVEAVVFGALVYKVTHTVRTSAGDALLSDMGTLFSGLKDRANSLKPGSQTQDFALLAAVFGMTAIPDTFDSARRLFRKSDSSSSYGTSCGSSSSCGSSGSSCGGGGGCGGCGGS